MAVSSEEVPAILGLDAVSDVVDVDAREELGGAEGILDLLLGCTIAEVGLWRSLDGVPPRWLVIPHPANKSVLNTSPKALKKWCLILMPPS